MDTMIPAIIAVTLLIILLPIAKLLSDNAKRKKQENLKRYGKIIEAKIIDFKQESLLHNNIILVRIIAEAFIYGKRYEFISEKMYPEKSDHFRNGDSVNILVNQENPKQYYFTPNDQKYSTLKDIQGKKK